MGKALRYGGQAVVYLLIAVATGYFANSPVYVHFPQNQALILLTLSHGAKPAGECRRLTREEMARTAANMRRTMVCPRQRLPITVELTLDGKPIYRDEVPPGGISGDAPSRIYQKFSVAPGQRRLVARLRDTARPTGFDYERTADIELAPGKRFVIDFRTEAGGFVFR